MDIEQFKKLLSQEEGATLEFKREPYRIDDENGDVKKRQRDELVKDLLALANGNAVVAGDPAYLIIGADDKLNTNNSRDIFDIGAINLTSNRVLDIVNSACDPKIADILCEPVEIDGKHLIGITVLPSPYLHETIRRLEPQSGTFFNEYTVFVRHNQSVRIASTKERDAIAKIKRIRFDERRNPPAISFGTVVGATIGGIIAAPLGEKALGKPEGKIGAGIAGVFVGGFVGGMMGNVYKDLYEIKSNWNRIPSEWRGITILLSAFGGLSAYVVLNQFFKPKRAKL